MLFKKAVLGGLLAAGASAQAAALFQRSEDFETQLRRDADMTVASLTERQDPAAAASAPKLSTTPQSGDASKADLQKWETETRAACMNALGTLNGQANNPSGIAVCYNLPFLDNTTGVFQAEFRMYNISAPVDAWKGVTTADVSMGLSYLGATIQRMTGTFNKREAEVEFSLSPVRARQEAATPINGMTEVKVLMYVGKINTNLMGKAMTTAALQPLLVPKINLEAKNPTTGEDVTTVLSADGASFVNGVFSKQAAAASVTDAPAAAASASAAVIKNAPFILPGTRLEAGYTGLIVTCIWTAGFIGAVGLGTVGRIQFREQYRRRMKREMVSNQRTI